MESPIQPWYCCLAVWTACTVLAIARDEGTTSTLWWSTTASGTGMSWRRPKLGEAAGVPFRVMPLDLRVFGGSALTDDIDIPTGEMNLKCKRTSP